MPVEPEVFVELETALTERMTAAFLRGNASTLRALRSALLVDNYGRAEQLVRQLDASEVIAEERGYIRFIGLEAAKFGAHLMRGDDEAINVGEGGVPQQVENSTAQLVRNLEGEGLERFHGALLYRLQQEAERAESQVDKSLTIVTKGEQFARAYMPFVSGQGQVFMNLGASVHNSRMSQWGFTTEARLFGWTTFAVNEQLDNRTCPVCNRLHGMVFTVEAAHTRLESHLAVDDLSTLKDIAPWPKQDAQSIATLEKMTAAELQQRGWDTPAYHPRCRGLLARTTVAYSESRVVGGAKPKIINPLAAPKLPRKPAIEPPALPVPPPVAGAPQAPASAAVGAVRDPDAVPVTPDVPAALAPGGTPSAASAPIAASELDSIIAESIANPARVGANNPLSADALAAALGVPSEAREGSGEAPRNAFQRLVDRLLS